MSTDSVTLVEFLLISKRDENKADQLNPAHARIDEAFHLIQYRTYQSILKISHLYSSSSQ